MKKQVYITSVEPGFVATKMSKSNRIFWLVPVDKAARQIQHAVEHKRRKVYISKRWWLVAKIMRWMPYWLYRRI